ncbi:MAG TPA: hypothetical protein VF703_08445 [Pyrinomonadaceae bacterium]
MKVAKNGIRVIKREERERQAQPNPETPDTEAAAEPGAHPATERELTTSVTEWVNDFLQRRHDGFQAEIGQIRATFDVKN